MSKILHLVTFQKKEALPGITQRYNIIANKKTPPFPKGSKTRNYENLCLGNVSTEDAAGIRGRVGIVSIVE